ncbi:MAG: short-chain dehydrogenase [Anaerolineaceae bacterium]|nr:short-chain dehydrogenase [Anaerolineaceae bacterium]
MMMDLQGKVVLVTGGAHRVGKAIVLKLAEMGAETIVFTYNSSAEAALKTQEEIQKLGCKVLAIQCNQSDISQIEKTMETIKSQLGRLDVLVNSASIFLTADFFAVTPESWDTVMNINARGPFFFMQMAGKMMLDQGSGLIINIVDESVEKPALSWIHHGASKAALWNITQSGAIALAPKIRVNAVMPGAVLKPPDWENERWESSKDSIPLRKLGSPDDVCKAIEFLVKSDFVTGQVIVVDGGATVI